MEIHLVKSTSSHLITWPWFWHLPFPHLTYSPSLDDSTSLVPFKCIHFSLSIASALIQATTLMRLLTGLQPCLPQSIFPSVAGVHLQNHQHTPDFPLLRSQQGIPISLGVNSKPSGYGACIPPRILHTHRYYVQLSWNTCSHPSVSCSLASGS